MAQASEQLTQCQRQLELERREVQDLAKRTDTMKKGCEKGESDLLRVMNEVKKV